MIKMGMLIGDRYEILEKIGTGGMSDVYKAKCHKLNRFVAVKVLKQEFSENSNFVSKFRIEAQAAAGLMHPNIVNVYDVGEEDGIYYIVMELVEGITLKKYIEKKARLSVKEAISIAIQVSMGIEAAHNNHIIHRDIKPQNIIISKEGKVKVTDFGIAKAATSNTITSNVMGSVHYTSPEQARGGYSDEKSDIYSLGITLFEMLTGRVPFNGETTVAIAIKHIQEEMPSPREFVSEIPISVEQIVFKCTQKSPDRRYQSMQELVTDLKKSLMNPDEDFVKVVDLDERNETKMVSNQEIARIKGNTQKAKPIYEEMPMEDPDEDEEDYDPKMDKLITILTIVAAVIIGCILLFIVGRAVGVFGNKNNTNQVEQKEEPVTEEKEEQEGVLVPSVFNTSLAEATAILQNEGFKVEKEEVYDDTIKKNYIVSQKPEAGSRAARDTTITLVVSMGAQENKVPVPDTLGMTEAAARTALEGAGLIVASVTEVADSNYAQGTVCYQSYSVGSLVPKGTGVDIRLSIGGKYSCNINVQAPIDYMSGSAIVILTADNGTQLFSTTVTSFPVPINLSGIRDSQGGVVTISYETSVQEEIVDEKDRKSVV